MRRGLFNSKGVLREIFYKSSFIHTDMLYYVVRVRAGK